MDYREKTETGVIAGLRHLPGPSKFVLITKADTKISNKLVNNPLQEGVLEFAYQGPRLKLISGKAKIAITGNVHFTIERQYNSSSTEQCNSFETYNLEEGDTIDTVSYTHLTLPTNREV